MPCLVDEVRIGGHRVDLDAQVLQLAVVLGQITQLGRADEREVTGVEEEDRPGAPHVGFGHLDEFARVVCVRGEGQNLGIDQRHEVCALLFNDVTMRTARVPTSGNGL